MAGSPGLIDPVEKAVFVAVDEDLVDALEMARLLALLPEPLARSAIVMGETGLTGKPDGFIVRVRDHQYISSSGVLNDNRNQSVAVSNLKHRIILPVEW